MGLKLKQADALAKAKSGGGSGGIGASALDPWGTEVGRVATQYRWLSEQADDLEKQAKELLDTTDADGYPTGEEPTPEARAEADRLMERAAKRRRDATSLSYTYGIAARPLDVKDLSPAGGNTDDMYPVAK